MKKQVKQVLNFLYTDKYSVSHIDLKTMAESRVSLSDDILNSKEIKLYCPMKKIMCPSALPSNASFTRIDNADYILYFESYKWFNKDGMRTVSKKCLPEDKVEFIEKQTGVTLDKIFYLSECFPITKKSNTYWLRSGIVGGTYFNRTNIPSIAAGDILFRNGSNSCIDSYNSLLSIMQGMRAADHMDMYNKMLLSMNHHLSVDYAVLMYIICPSSNILLDEFVHRYRPKGIINPTIYGQCNINIEDEVELFTKAIDCMCPNIAERDIIIDDYRRRLNLASTNEYEYIYARKYN